MGMSLMRVAYHWPAGRRPRNDCETSECARAVSVVAAHGTRRETAGQRVPWAALRGSNLRTLRDRLRRSVARQPSRLLSSIQRGDLEGVRRLLAAGADPNAECHWDHVKVTKSHSVSTTGWCALHHAAYHGHTEIGRLLLDAGAVVNAEGRYPGQPIAQAARMGHVDFVRLLLERGADPAAAIGPASSHLACVRLLVEAGADPSDCVRTAVMENQIEVLAYALERGAEPRGVFAYERSDGRVVSTPRMAAVYYKRPECRRLLRGRRPYESLSDAAADGNCEAADELLQAGSSVDELETHDRRPMYWALQAGEPEMVEWLLAHGASLQDIGSFSSAARSAIEGGSLAVLEIMKREGIAWKNALRTAVAIPVSRFDPSLLTWVLTNVPSDEGEKRSAVWNAVAHDRLDVLKILVAHGFELERQEPPDTHETTLMTAAQHGSLEVFEYLLERGADPFARHRGSTVLDHALEGTDWDRVYEFDEEDLEEPIPRRLLALGVGSKWLPKKSPP